MCKREVTLSEAALWESDSPLYADGRLWTNLPGDRNRAEVREVSATACHSDATSSNCHENIEVWVGRTFYKTYRKEKHQHSLDVCRCVWEGKRRREWEEVILKTQSEQQLNQHIPALSLSPSPWQSTGAEGGLDLNACLHTTLWVAATVLHSLGKVGSDGFCTEMCI